MFQRKYSESTGAILKKRETPDEKEIDTHILRHCRAETCGRTAHPDRKLEVITKLVNIARTTPAVMEEESTPAPNVPPVHEPTTEPTNASLVQQGSLEQEPEQDAALVPPTPTLVVPELQGVPPVLPESFPRLELTLVLHAPLENTAGLLEPDVLCVRPTLTAR